MNFESLSSFAGCVVGLSGKDAYVLEAEAVARGLDVVQHRRLFVWLQVFFEANPHFPASFTDVKIVTSATRDVVYCATFVFCFCFVFRVHQRLSQSIEGLVEHVDTMTGEYPLELLAETLYIR